MNEISLSKEAYNKHPSWIFAAFIYGVFILIAVALIWGYWGKIDIVVRASGIIRPHTHAALVINAVHGDVQRIYFYEGKEVAAGDILFAIDTFQLENEYRILSDQLEVIAFDLASLELLYASINSKENLVQGFNYELSARFDAFLVTFNAIEHGTLNRVAILEDSQRGLDESIQYASFEIEVLQIFERSILNDTNLFTGNHHIGNSRKRDIFNTHQNNFLQHNLESDDLRFQISTYSHSYGGLMAIRTSIDTGYSDFGDYEFSIYRNRYDEYISQLDQLTLAYTLAREYYHASALLYEFGVIPSVEMQTALSDAENASTRLSSLTTNFIIGIENELRNTRNQLVRLENQLNIAHANTLSNIGNQILSLENSVQNMNRALAQSQLEQEAIFFVNGQAGDSVALRSNETNNILEQISRLEQEKNRLSLMLSGIAVNIEDSTVRSPIYGYVSVHSEITENTFIMAGVYVLSVIPTRDEVLNAHIFVSNNDIGRITDGMTVRYNIAAMPRRDFGEINGIVTRISTDTLADTGYFLVESELEDILHHDTRGNTQELRVGMGFEARIIVEQQRILFYLLDRLNLMIN